MAEIVILAPTRHFGLVAIFGPTRAGAPGCRLSQLHVREDRWLGISDEFDAVNASFKNCSQDIFAALTDYCGHVLTVSDFCKLGEGLPVPRHLRVSAANFEDTRQDCLTLLTK